MLPSQSSSYSTYTETYDLRLTPFTPIRTVELSHSEINEVFKYSGIWSSGPSVWLHDWLTADCMSEWLMTGEWPDGLTVDCGLDWLTDWWLMMHWFHDFHDNDANKWESNVVREWFNDSDTAIQYFIIKCQTWHEHVWSYSFMFCFCPPNPQQQPNHLFPRWVRHEWHCRICTTNVMMYYWVQRHRIPNACAWCLLPWYHEMIMIHW